MLPPDSGGQYGLYIYMSVVCIYIYINHRSQWPWPSGFLNDAEIGGLS